MSYEKYTSLHKACLNIVKIGDLIFMAGGNSVVSRADRYPGDGFTGQ